MLNMTPRIQNCVRRLAPLLLLTSSFVWHASCDSSDLQDTPRIAVLQNRPQEWADALKLGFGDGLRAAGLEVGTDVIIVTRSAAGDPQGLSSLAESVARQHFDVLYSLGTQASQEAVRVAEGTPVIFGAVTDPVAAGLVSSLQDRPENVTGTQDLWPYSAQFELMTTLLPDLQSVGVLYNSSEVNSQVSVARIKEEADGRNINIVERTVTEDAQVSLAIEGLLASGVRAIFIPADNTAQAAADVIIATALQARVPVFTGIPGIVERGALGTVGTNYYELGKVNAAQALEILQGTPANKVGIRIAETGDLYLHLGTARRLGIEVPEELIVDAVEVYR